jgi:uncharacterized LabA/DUF88 family protein
VPRTDKAYVFVDNSNMFIEGKKIAGARGTPPVSSNGLYRIDYGRLLTHVLAGREMAESPKLYGSRPPANDSLWEVIRQKGFDTKVFDRNWFNKEKGVDMRMGLDIQRTCLRSEKADIVLVAGDADFIPCVSEIHREGWYVEVWFWSCAAIDLRTSCDQFVPLDSDVWNVGFES